jgi:peptidoglycan/xylan/chitin deacetylase (PgdA/CDA1 family)
LRVGPLVLCYHAVSDEWSHQLAVPAAVIERQLRSLLRRRFLPVSAVEAISRRGRVLHVTFDDAFKSVANAVPILERLGVPATVFAVSALADDGAPLAVPELAAEAAAHPRHLATMDWAELGELTGRGFEIGSHTVSHAHLTQLSDAELDRELGDSRTRIEDELRRPCRLLAYTYGEHDARVHAAAGRCGYTAAFALWPGSTPHNPFALPRVDIYRRDSLLRATLKTSFVKPVGSALLSRVRRAAS